MQRPIPGPRSGAWIANQTLWTTMVRVTGKTATTHGLRASFRPWAGDKGVAPEVAEGCLAHGKKDAVEQAYNRADMVERRRVVMQDWADFLDGKASAKVVSMGAAKRRGKR